MDDLAQCPEFTERITPAQFNFAKRYIAESSINRSRIELLKKMRQKLIERKKATVS